MYAMTIENRGDARYHATSHGYAFVLGPEGAGANPGDTLLAALCGCMGHYVRQFLKERGKAAGGFAIHAEAQSTRDETRLARIDVRIDLGRLPLDERERVELLDRAERCKIHNTLKAAVAVNVSLGQRRCPEAAPPAGAGGCG
jgi:uncharacterized OsmC-like protein